MPDAAPAGFHSVTPYLLLDDADEFLEFARTALGAEIRSLHHDDDGRLVHGEFAVCGSVLEIGEPKGDPRRTRCSFHVFVDDPDTAWARAVEAGATPLYEVTDHDYGERSGGVADPWDNHWYLARVIDAKARAG